MRGFVFPVATVRVVPHPRSLADVCRSLVWVASASGRKRGRRLVARAIADTDFLGDLVPHADLQRLACNAVDMAIHQWEAANDLPVGATDVPAAIINQTRHALIVHAEQVLTQPTHRTGMAGGRRLSFVHQAKPRMAGPPAFAMGRLAFPRALDPAAGHDGRGDGTYRLDDWPVGTAPRWHRARITPARASAAIPARRCRRHSNVGAVRSG